MVEKISSFQNSMIKEALALREAKERRELNKTIVDGNREISRALLAGIDFEKVFFCPDLIEGREEYELLAKLKSKRIKIVEVTQDVFEKIAFGQRLEGLVAICRVQEKTLSEIKPTNNSFFVIAEGLEKPGNIGAILRTCDAAGVDGLLLVNTKTDLFNPNVIRSSTGTVFVVPTACATEEAIIGFLDRYKIKTCGLFPECNEDYTDVDLSGPMAIVLGSEDKGLSDFWKKHVGKQMRIPMRGQADSLNVSVCAAIVIYEAMRQRSLKQTPTVFRRSAKKF